MLKWLLALLLVISNTCLCEERSIRFAINDSLAMPLAEFVDGQPVAGVLFDLQRRLAEKVGLRAQFIVLPRLRIQRALAAGEVDVRCYVSPNWLGDEHYNYVWSLPFMTQRDLLVTHRTSLTELDQLSQERIGTVHGYSYPEIESLFANGHLIRDDARTQEQVMLKLSARRYAYAVSNDLSLSWYNRHLPAEQQLIRHTQLSEDPVACIVRNDAGVPTMKLLRAMVRMKEDGEFDAILARYR